MLRVGLTGGIGAGKSTVARRLAEHGAVVVDADALAREAVAPGSEGLREVVAAFGSGVLTSEGALDRPEVARRVFSDEAERARLNSIVHPRVAELAAAAFEAAPADAVVVHDIPLLVEKGMSAQYHLAVVVMAPESSRVDRLRRTRGMTEAEARSRIGSQATDEERRAAADVLLSNTASRQSLLAEVDVLWRERLVPFERNVRLARSGRDGTAPVLVDHDPDWVPQAARLVERVRRAAGNAALRVDHVGSTSVPHLPAKDVLDLQLTVADLETADALAAPLAAAGFPRYEGIDS
ncbi:dephospho-CoA kinase, partial [Actinoalloteichus spitiensis]|uniref:dephospho-CoA kinase n=1 Tax=Actinoalloteichus spitiensis TaxID=252394 RepID=UPI000361FB90